MSHFPKFVLERLKASTSQIGHPDPDVLTAFSERSLPARERTVVMEHLARCGECREVVALALPTVEPATQPASAHRDWITWPVLRWSAVAAGVLIIAAIGVQQYRERHAMIVTLTAPDRAAREVSGPPPEARTEAPKTKIQAALEPPPAPPPSQQGPAAGHTSAVSTENGAIHSQTVMSQPQDVGRMKGAAAGGGLGGPLTKAPAGASGQGTKFALNLPPQPFFDAQSSAVRAKQLPAPAHAQTPSVPSASEMVQVEAVPPAVAQPQSQAQTQGQLQDLSRAQAQQESAGQASTANDNVLSKAKPANQQLEVSGAASAAPVGIPQPAAPNAGVVAFAPVTWTITSTGGLQRSFDNGKTWQDVVVPAYPANTSKLMQHAESVMVSAEASPSLQKEAKSDKPAGKVAGNVKDKKTLSNSIPVFRAVSANGTDVWAGGAGGALFHSVDSGDHWTRIFPLAGSVLLIADITSVQFSDPLNGTITTANSEIWMTADGGRSWQKH